MHLIYSFQNVDFQELLNEQESTHGEFLLIFVDLLLTDPPYNARSDHENVSFDYIIVTL